MRKIPFFFAVLALGFLAFGEDIVHILQKGETLFGLGRRYGVSTEEIMKANGITNPDKLNAGIKLKIPSAAAGNASPGAAYTETYIVEKGDSLYGLARRFGVSVSELASANGLDRNASLRIGDRLSVPADPSAGSSSGTPSVAQGRKDGGAEKPVSVEDPRSYVNKTLDPNIIWPVEAEEIAYLTGKVYGVSITSSKGADVKTIASGTVLSIGPYRGFGQVVFVQSNNGYIYVYGGLEDIGVSGSDSLGFGDKLGRLGTDPLSGKPQLYFMVYKKDFPVDPATAPRG